MEYRPVIKGAQQCAWIVHLAKNGQLWDDEDDCEKLKNMEGTASSINGHKPYSYRGCSESKELM
jgi:hypothetical protein